MKPLIGRYIILYKDHCYLDKKKAEYTGILYIILSLYAVFSCLLFPAQAIDTYVVYYVGAAIVASFLALIKKKLVLGQNLLLSMLIALAAMHYPVMERFHFYSELIILLFVTIIIYVRRYQFLGVLMAIFLGFYGRYQMLQSYMYILDHERIVASQHVFIMATLFMLVLLSFYVERIIHRGIKENKQLEESVHIDLLTGLYTRTKFNEDVKKIDSSTCNDFNEIGILDIDKFKVVNDTYGHHTGDVILKRLADEMKLYFPEPEHRLYRWGGEEFIVLSSQKSSEAFDETMDAFRKHIDQRGLVEDLNVTISIGTTSMDKPTFKTTFCTADNALYKAKALGRNLLVRGVDSSECLKNEITESI